MYKIDFKKDLPIIGVIVLTFVAGIIIYPQLPQQIPMHWNIRGEVDNMMTKSLFSAFLMPLLALVTYVLCVFLPLVDPNKEKYEKFTDAYRLIIGAIVFIECLVFAAVMISSLGHQIPMHKTIPALVAILFMVIGNVLGKLRQNWFVGIKLPWTLKSENVWNKTHRLGGRLFVLSGVLGLIGILLPPMWTAIFLMVPLGGTIIGVAVYSYVMYKKEIER